MEELHALRKVIEADPRNKATDGLYLYTPSARRKLAEIDYAITSLMQEKRKGQAE